MKSFIAIMVAIATLLNNSALAFAPVGNTCYKTSSIVPSTTFSNTQGSTYISNNQPIAIQKQRSSMASVQTMGLFGLGGPEIAVILIAGAFLLGPSKLAELGKEAGKMAGELKEVPKEFQEGLAEGEAEAQKMKKEIAASTVKDAEKEE